MSQSAGALGEPAAHADGLALRASDRLAFAPVPRAPAPPAVDSEPRPAPMTAHAGSLRDRPPVPAPATEFFGIERSTWVVCGAAFAATVSWMVERRQRLLLERGNDAKPWLSLAGPRQGRTPTASPAPPSQALVPASAAWTLDAASILTTTSRREATLADLHQLQEKLLRRRERGDPVAAQLLLEQHLADFRFSSPWVFLELREIYRQLGRPEEWEIAREAFRQRFGQNPPTWDAPSTHGVELAEDRQLATELARSWPHREARVFILRWMLGEPQMRLQSLGPPLLGLGVYRDLLLLDRLLDDVVVRRPA